MSINEWANPHSDLTEKQQKEAMRNVYGLGGNMSPSGVELTYEERIRMRRLLDALDQKEAGGAKEFDLNNPPTPKYRHQEFPFLLYRHETRETLSVHSDDERELALSQGWSRDPFPSDVIEIELTPAEREQAAILDKQLKKRKQP